MRLPGLFGVLVGTIVSIKEVFVAGGAPDRLNVHLVCHTHDDPGWLKTVDQYYYGANNTIAHAGVQYILDSVVDALDANPSRKFIYAEQAFMWRWWRRQGNERRKQVRRLVKEGRLSFVNGGWVMHDEATAHFVGMVDQTHLGHAFLRRLFGEEALPRVAWQIDPFGHSSTQASLLGAQAGFEALYFGRIDYQDSEKRIAESDMEMVWRASRSFEEGAQIFTGVFHSGNYGPPVGFCFDQVCRDEPIMDDPIMADYNVERRASEFADACEELGRHTRGNDVMLQMGGDFAFENANAWFKNLDKLVEAVNNEGRVHVFYSTPAQYTRAKHRSSLEWTVKEDDFFPYADCPDCYWTGFYSSRPGLKRLERVTSGYLQAARQLHALAGARGFDEHWKAVVALEQAQALIQHHDAVTGTSKQHVAEDYAQRLDKARVMAEGAVSSWLSRLAFGGGRAGISPQEDALPELVQCRFANVSVCDVTTKAESGFEAVIYNPMAQTRSGFIDIPVSWSEISGVHDEQGRPIDWQILPYHTRSSVGERRAMKGVLSTANRGSYTLVVPVDAAPLGLEHFHVAAPAADRDGSKTEAGSEEVGSKVDEEHGSGESEGTERDVVKGAKESTFSWARGRENLANGIEGETPESERRLRAEGRAKSTMSGSEGGGEEPAVEDVTLSNGLISVTFDGASGRIKGVDNLEEGVGGSLDIDQGWFFYPTFDDRQIAKGAGANGGTDVGDDRSGEVPGEHVGSAGAGASRVHQGLPEKLTRSRGQPGGAYIFRPNDSYGRARPVGLAKSTQGKMGKEYEYDESGLILKDWWVSAEGPLVWEVHQVFSDWISQSVRLRRGSSHVELEWSVGPVPVGDDRGANDGKGGKYDNGGDDDDDNDAAAVGKEVISRFAASALSSEGVFYTDANGREFQKRKRDHRPTWDINVTQPVAGNYYPITAATFIRDERDAPDSMQLSVLTDRAQGCASLADGELELLAHRRLLSEDQRGVGEALNETDGGMSHYPDWQRSGEGEVFRGTHYLIVSKTSSAMKAVRGLMDQVFSPFVAAFAERSDTGDGAKSVGVDDMSRHIENAGSSLQDFSPGGSGIDANELDVGLDHGLVRELGENVGLMTLMRLPPRRERDGAAAEIDKRMPLLVRLAHRFAPGEDSALSQPATVDLSRLLSGHSLVYAEEIALTGGASLAARRQRLRWETEEQGRTQSMSSHTEASTLGDGTVVHSETGTAATAIFDAGADGDGGGDGDDIYDDDDEEEDDDASLLTVWESSREGGRRHGAREAKAEGVLVCDLRRTGQSEAFKKRQCLTVLAPMEIKTFRLLVVPETV